MTGIFLYYSKKDHFDPIELTKNADLISHRGNYKTISNATLKDKIFLKVFVNEAQKNNTSIAISGINSQQVIGYCAIDGAILNEREIKTKSVSGLPENSAINTVIFQGYSQLGHEVFNKMHGMYSILIINENGVVAAKDPVGFNPLYVLNTEDYLIIASELKALTGFKGTPNILDPGFVFSYNFTTQAAEYYAFFPTINYTKEPVLSIDALETIKKKIFEMLDGIVAKNVNAPCPVASLLSGGIDSAVICALAQKYIPNLRVYTVAAENSPDLEHAKNLAQMYPKIQHNIFKIGFEELNSVLRDVIYHLETFDAALIRSALPMYYICSKVDKDVGVLLTGEGGDELFGGYEYLKDLSPDELSREFIDMMEIEHATGLQRVDRIPYAFGLEARAPWFDFSLAKYAFQIPISLKIKKEGDRFIEKWIMREAFKSILPESIYLRKKAKFSQGVGSELIMRDYCAKTISDEEFEREKHIFPKVSVKNKEELYYWRIFKELFQPDEKFIESMPRTSVFTL